MTWYSVNRIGDTAHCAIYDAIGCGGQSAKDFIAALGDASKVDLLINSDGGCSIEALAIAEFLQRRETTITVTEHCFSSGMIVAMGGTVTAHSTAKFLVHAPCDYVLGSAATLRWRADVLDKLTARIVKLFTHRTGQTEATVNGWLAGDTYFTAAEAQAARLIHAVMEPPQTVRQMIDARQAAQPGHSAQSAVESLLWGFLASLGPVPIADRERFDRELSAWVAMRCKFSTSSITGPASFLQLPVLQETKSPQET